MDAHDGRNPMRVIFEPTGDDALWFVNSESGHRLGIIRRHTPIWVGAAPRWAVIDSKYAYSTNEVRVAESLEQAMDEATDYFRDLELCAAGCGQMVRGQPKCKRCTNIETAIETPWRKLESRLQGAEGRAVWGMLVDPEEDVERVYIQLEATTIPHRDDWSIITHATVIAAEVTRAPSSPGNSAWLTLHQMICLHPYNDWQRQLKQVAVSTGCISLRDFLNEQFPPDQE
jgi:hypothetical protein